ncbi:hypothetical protein BDN70DRAFT_883160 [Pholiota conissans]|uniref:JmjC domain-containing protein n=1 Tax=Pholiota conissans TaxID=109636 RepID=A0A9P6CWN9_9AGAR|nr:hypothetical protein BDN70DRAFT_883160 [Pholiota conissans]
MASTKNWTLGGILSQGSNFHAVHRVSILSDALSETILEYDAQGVPLVIEDFHKHPEWPQYLFTLDKFIDGTSPNIHVRNVHDCTDSTLPLKDFISKCRLSNVHRTCDEKERFYGKDAECPKDWELWLQNGGVMPEMLLGKGSQDLFRCRPKSPEAVVDTLMCYLGIGDTFTPCHKDLCASSGQNLMCYTERNGSSFWFMTESSSATAVSEYFRDKLGREVDNENYIATIEDLTNAPFNVYILQQDLGDMVLVPPRSCHQVMNSGGITVKTSWSRMTLEGLVIAYHYELSIYRRVGRPETYRIKSTIHHALVWMTNKLQQLLNKPMAPKKSDNFNHCFLIKDLKVLLSLYDRILAEEYDAEYSVRKEVVYESNTFNDDVRLVCDFCSADIFQSFFECRHCCDSDDDPCQLCPGCYVEGRNCRCSGMEPMQYQKFQHLIDTRRNCVDAIHAYASKFKRSFEEPFVLGELRADFAALFQAACTLYRNRRDPKRVSRMCKLKEQTHEAKPQWTLNCKKCHKGKCFPHLLANCSMHSAEALLYCSLDASHDEYHRRHLGASLRFDKEIGALKDSRSQGIPPQGSAYHLLAENSMQYMLSRPRNAKYMMSGWYDTPLYAIMPETTQLITPFSPSTYNGWSSCEETTDEPIISEVVPMEVHNTQRIPSMKRRKQVLFVDVPKAPYNITRTPRLTQKSKKAALLIKSIPSSIAQYRSASSSRKRSVSHTKLTITFPGSFSGTDSDQSRPNIKFGPPIGVARASKSRQQGSHLDITHSPAPQSPSPFVTLPDGETPYAIWRERMMSPSFLFEGEIISFDNTMVP